LSVTSFTSVLLINNLFLKLDLQNIFAKFLKYRINIEYMYRNVDRYNYGCKTQIRENIPSDSAASRSDRNKKITH